MSTEAAPPPPTDDALEAAAAQEPPPDADAMAELAAANQQLSFAQQPMVQNVLPFVTSVAVHLGILLISWVLWDNRAAIGRVVEEQIIVPEAAIVEGADVGGIPNPGLGGDPTRAAAQDLTADTTASDSWAERKSEALQANLMGASESEQTSDTIIGLGTTGAASDVQAPGQGGGGASDGSGQIAPFGVPGGGGGIGPKASFVGISGNARRVVYVCDATGTMLGLKFKLLQKQLYKAIDILKPIQGFNVVFFKGGDSDAEWSNPFAEELVVANPANKQRVRQFIDQFQVVGKGTNPLPALRLAFQQKPQLVYFLTDGEFNNVVGYDQVLTEVRKLNADKSVKVNTIAFMSEDEKAEEALQQMARENGGRFVKVSDRDLE
ncbi:MAG TPA: hypothetical protein VGR35_17145 [Tepidisphaeraceae bacterium]|nr:hypothetical protein [Tepidisphaeraceae bacterium]